MQRLIAKMTLPAYWLYWRVMKPKTTRVRAVVISHGNILLVRHIGKKVWSFPSGMVEKSETLFSALKRELFEELGIRIVPEHVSRKLGTYRQKTKTRDDTVHVFVVELPHMHLPHLQWELEEARWFSLSVLPSNLQRGIHQRIIEYKEGKEQVYLPW